MTVASLRCGLVALVMAARLLSHQLAVDEVLKVAKEKQFSNHGEMFSVYNMKQLVEEFINVEVNVLDDILRNRSRVIEHLMSGWPVLVPYDSDANHEPTIRNGHRAHWAIIVGFCVLDPGSNSPTELKPLLKVSNSDLKSKLEKCPDNLFMVLARQGKSRYIKWWPLDRLCYSNRGLEQVNPEMNYLEIRHEFVVPENGNLKESLANQFLIIKPK